MSHYQFNYVAELLKKGTGLFRSGYLQTCAQLGGGHGGLVLSLFQTVWIQYAMSPTFFFLPFSFGEVSKMKVTFVAFCVKSFSS